jgi:hypothetical protein
VIFEAVVEVLQILWGIIQGVLSLDNGRQPYNADAIHRFEEDLLEPGLDLRVVEV